MLDKLGGRKVIMCLAFVAISVGIILIKGDLPSSFVDLLKFILGAFITGNAVEHLHNAVVEHAEVRANAPVASPVKVDLSGVEHGMQAVSAQMGQLAELNNHILQTSQINQQGLALLVDRLVPKARNPQE